MRVNTRYGQVGISLHAVERWQERTERTPEEMVAAVVSSHRPSKQELRKIMKRMPWWQPQRILECSCAYFILRNSNIVTVYDKPKEIKMQHELVRPYTTAHSRSAIVREIEMAEALIEHDGTSFPDDTFEDGYIAALKFILGEQGSNVNEEFKDLMLITPEGNQHKQDTAHRIVSVANEDSIMAAQQTSAHCGLQKQTQSHEPSDTGKRAKAEFGTQKQALECRQRRVEYQKKMAIEQTDTSQKRE